MPCQDPVKYVESLLHKHYITSLNSAEQGKDPERLPTHWIPLFERIPIHYFDSYMHHRVLNATMHIVQDDDHFRAIHNLQAGGYNFYICDLLANLQVYQPHEWFQLAEGLILWGKRLNKGRQFRLWREKDLVRCCISLGRTLTFRQRCSRWATKVGTPSIVPVRWDD